MNLLRLTILLTLVSNLFAADRPKPPHIIVVKHKLWQVVFSKYLGVDELGNKYLGITDHDTNTITLLAGEPVGEECDTLIHETEHAFSGLNFVDAVITGHKAIYALTPAFTQIWFRDNPKLTKYATAACASAADEGEEEKTNQVKTRIPRSLQGPLL